jgi:hypothetical protein
MNNKLASALGEGDKTYTTQRTNLMDSKYRLDFIYKQK